MAVTLAACVQSGDSGFTPKPIETITPSAPTTSATQTPTQSATSASPSVTPTKPAVKASGTMSIYGEISKALTGTCQTVDGAPTITLADHANEFYKKVDLTAVLDATKKTAASVDVAFAEDSEGFAWTLSYSAAQPVAGTSAKVRVSGSTYTISGKLQAKETRKSKTITEVLPFTIVAKCAGTDW